MAGLALVVISAKVSIMYFTCFLMKYHYETKHLRNRKDFLVKSDVRPKSWTIKLRSDVTVVMEDFNECSEEAA
jgi:hypothetical protein